MKEKYLLAAAKYSRVAFNDLQALNVTNDLTEVGKLIFGEIEKYYETDPKCESVETDVLLSRIKRRVQKDSQFKELAHVVEGLSEGSPSNVVDEVNALRRDNVADDLAAAFSQRDFEKADKLIGEYEILNAGATDHINTPKDGLALFDTFFEETSEDNLIMLSPRRLNEALGGGLRRHHHLIFFARPDMGKSTWAIHQAAFFLRQGLKVLYVSNEEHEADYRDKIVTRILKQPPRWVRANAESARKALQKANFHNFIFKSLEPGTPKELVALAEEVKPDVLIVDQTLNLNMGDPNKVTSMDKAEQFIRNIGKRYNMLTISLTQAGDSATGKAVLCMEDIYFSNTGVQATADVIIGMGANREQETSGDRMLICCKNKRSGDKAPFPARIDFVNYRVV